MENNISLFEGKRLILTHKEGVMLPLNLQLNGMIIIYATAEIQDIQENKLSFRLSQPEDVIKIRTDREILPSSDYELRKQGKEVLITSKKYSKVDDQLTIYFIYK